MDPKPTDAEIGGMYHDFKTNRSAGQVLVTVPPSSESFAAGVRAGIKWLLDSQKEAADPKKDETAGEAPQKPENEPQESAHEDAGEAEKADPVAESAAPSPKTSKSP